MVDTLQWIANVLRVAMVIPIWGIFTMVMLWQVTRLYDLWRFYKGKSSAFGDGKGANTDE